MEHTPYHFQPFDPAPPIPNTLKKRYINIHHPAFQTSNCFLHLLATDGVPQTQTAATVDDGEPSSSTTNVKYGVHHGTVLDICCIIAENQPGFLSVTANRADRLDSNLDDLLLGTNYFYFLEDESLEDNYPIVLTFADWEFPAEIPSRWEILTVPGGDPLGSSASDMSSTVKTRDSICRISGYGDELESAQIIPKAELRWFVKNNMAQYNANEELEPDDATQDVQNGIALRKDIHSALDNKKFVVVPKFGKPVAHFRRPTNHLGMLYHNAIVDLPPGMRGEFWYGRLAFNTFPVDHGWGRLHEDMPIVSRQGGTRVVTKGPPPLRSPRRGKRSARSSQGSDSEMPPSKKAKDGEDVQAAAEASSSRVEEAGELDSKAEYQEELQLQRKRFPFMSQEYHHSNDVDWNMITWYPGQKRFKRRVKQYIYDHPAVKAVAEPEKAAWVDPEYPYD